MSKESEQVKKIKNITEKLTFLIGATFIMSVDKDEDLLDKILRTNSELQMDFIKLSNLNKKEDSK